mgnify:CR=1 FL=1
MKYSRVSLPATIGWLKRSVLISSKHRKTLIKLCTYLTMVFTGMTLTLISAAWKAIEWVTVAGMNRAHFIHYARKNRARKPPSLTLLSLTTRKKKPSTKSKVARTQYRHQNYGITLQSSLRLQAQSSWKKLVSTLTNRGCLKNLDNGFKTTPVFNSRVHWRKD